METRVALTFKGLEPAFFSQASPPKSSTPFKISGNGAFRTQNGSLGGSS